MLIFHHCNRLDCHFLLILSSGYATTVRRVVDDGDEDVAGVNTSEKAVVNAYSP